MPQSINIPTRNWQVGIYEAIINQIPADATGVVLEFDTANFPARYFGDPAGPLASWDLQYSADGVIFGSFGSGDLYNVQNPRNGITIVRITKQLESGLDLNNPRRNPNQIRGVLVVHDVTIRMPVRLFWSNQIMARQS